MRVLWLADIVNLCLDPLLIFGLGPFPELGVTGAAVATTTGRGVGVLVQLLLLWRGVGRVVIRRQHLVVDPRVMTNMLRLSASAVFQSLIATTSYVGVVRIVAGFGSHALAGYTIAIRIVIFALWPSWGLANAAATLVGQNLGATGLVFLIFAAGLVSAFTTDPLVVATGATALRIISSGFVLYAFGFVLSMSFNGAGDTRTPTIINLFCFWLFEVPLAYVLARPLGMGPSGVFWSIAVAFSLMAVVSGLLFRRGTWKQVRV
jgi:Na+-driven multidrug efflux pump